MADTFTNDLRLRLQESGSNAGTWGDLLNGTITNIASALGQGSEAIPNASTHTITLADGTADEARSLYLKCTGGGQACTVTLGPNTISKVWIIDNATSYTLTFSQGSGANVAIAAGAVKVIATDGAGSGAAVVDTLDGLEGSMSTLAVSGAFTNGSTLVSTGKITADAGIDIDNINIDGTTIALSSGDLTLDVAGDIILDADGADVIFKDGGTQIGRIRNVSSGEFTFQSDVSDKDIIFNGNDGGSTITALTLDMSDAGTAIFNHDIKTAGNGNALTFSSAAGGGGGTNTINFKHDLNTLAAAQIVASYTSDYRATLDFKINKAQSDSTPTSALLINQTGVATFSSGAIFTDGNLTVADGHGIDFSATSGSGDSELLDDYEEGTATLTLSTTGTAPTIEQGNTFTIAYTKIGNLVRFVGYTGARNVTNIGTGVAKITGLPFTQNGSFYGHVTFTHSTLYDGNVAIGYIEAGNTFFFPIVLDSTSPPSYRSGTRFSMVQGFYHTA